MKRHYYHYIGSTILWLLLPLALAGCGSDEPEEKGGGAAGDLKSYVVGDFYEAGGVKGVVFQVDATPTRAAGVAYKTGMIISVDETQAVWSDVDASLTNCTHADGEKNSEQIKKQLDWGQHYPALKWGSDKNQGIKEGEYNWYLPSVEELGEFFLAYYGIPQGKTIEPVNLEKKNGFDKAFKDKGGVVITTENIRARKSYWTSTTETRTKTSGTSLEDNTFNWTTYVDWGDVSGSGGGFSANSCNKANVYYVRAVCKIKVKAD